MNPLESAPTQGATRSSTRYEDIVREFHKLINVWYMSTTDLFDDAAPVF